MANPLFREFDRFARDEARRVFQRTDAYKTYQQVRHALNTPTRVTTSVDKFSEMIGQYSRHGMRGGFFKAARGLGFQDMVREVVKYQASGGESARLVQQLLGALGPMGRLLKSMLRPGSRTRGGGLEGEIEAAVNLLQAFAPDKLSPALRDTTAGQVADSLEAAVARLESEGYEVTGPGLPKPMREAPSTLFPKVPRVKPQRRVIVPVAPGQTPGRIRPIPQRPRRPAPDDPLTTPEEPFLPGGVPKTTKEGADRVQVEIEGRRFPTTHPVVTKEMVPVSSSNVHSIGYDYDSLTLYVRYLALPRFGGGKGSLYGYSGVSLSQFMALYDAPSKGTWMWDNIRIRGTWSGHRHDYRLVAVRHDYVPRKATFVGGGREKFIPRTVRVQSRARGVRTLRSALPESFAPELALPDQGLPNTGAV